MPDVAELGRKVKAKYPGAYDDLNDADLGRKVKAKYPGAYDDFTDTPTAQPGFLERLPGNISSAAQQGYEGLKNKVGAFGELFGGVATGDFRPLLEAGEQVGRGLLSTAGYLAAGAPQDPRIAQIQQQQAERRVASGDLSFQQNAQRQAELEAQAQAADPSLSGRITRAVVRGGVEQLPTIGAGILSGGGTLPIAATAAAGNLDQPQSIPANVGLSVLPIPVGRAFKAGVNTVRRTFGKGAAQIIEAEALPAATAQVREAVPAVGETVPATGNANPVVQQAMTRFQQAVEEINASNLSPAEKAAQLESAIQSISREASGIPPVSDAVRRGYPGPMTFPENPNPIQLRPSIMPGESAAMEGPPPLEADMGAPSVRAGAEPSYKETVGPSLSRSAAYEVQPGAGAPTGTPPPELTGNVFPHTPKQQGLFTPEGAPPPELGGKLFEGEPVQQALMEGVRGLPVPIATRIKNEFLGLLGASKSLRSTADISYPLRQGALLLLRPLQWRQSKQVMLDMFRAFKPKNFKAINEAIAANPDAQLGKNVGLALDVGEEAFAKRAGSVISEAVQKTPILKHSEQAYNTAANVQRFQAFQQYKGLIDKAGLSPEEAMKGYKAAADWINITTGRGSLGQKIDRSFEALNFLFFSPRYIASRLNVLNPAMYIRNAMSPGGRVVLKQQMSDLVQFASVAATTMYLAKQAGADVGLNYHSPDFGKIKFGNYRYDLGAGLTQTLRLIFRVGEDFMRAAKGEKPQFGKTAIDIGETFLSYKLSPPAAVFRDFINQRTLDKKPFTYGGAAVDLVAPMQWADFVDAYRQEGWGGVLKSAPGVLGVGVQNYDSPPVQAAVEKAQPLFSELQRLNLQVPALRKRGEGDKMEPDDIFNKRVQQFGQNYTQYGLQLIGSPRFQAAPDNIKAEAVKRLGALAQGLTTKEFAFPELVLEPNQVMDSVEGSIERKQERIKQRGF